MTAITNFGTLKTSVAQWLARDSLTSRIPDFIQIAEVWINTELPLRLTRVEDSPVGTVGSRQITLPSDWLEPISLFLRPISGAGVQTELKMRAASMFAYPVTIGIPTKWCVTGSTIQFDVALDAAYTFRRIYWQKSNIDQASDSNTTDLLTNYPDIYLFATLTEAFAAADDPDNAAFWGSRRNDRRDQILWQQARNLAGMATLSVDNALRSRGAFNITSGDTV